MKRILLFLAVGSLHAASYYVSSAGNDSTGTGSSGAPWLTLSHAVGAVASGDTINIVANGSAVTCDATLPATVSNITVQSSKLAMLHPVGYRVNPTVDSANLGKCQFASVGITAQGEAHGFSAQFAAYQPFTINASTGVFTLTSGNTFPSNSVTFANGVQVDFEINNEFNGDTIPPNTVAVPSPLTILTHYYVVNCSVSPVCGNQNSTFQVSAASGGSPITGMTCDSDCQAYSSVGLPLSVNTSTDVIAANDTLGAVYANGTPVTFASGGLQLGGTLPAPLQQDVIYYIVNKSGNTFKVSATLGGSALDLTTVGTGMITASNANVPHGWKFSGIEFAPATGVFLVSVITLGGGSETSQYSMPNHFELDRVWIHDFSNAQNGPRRGITDNSEYLYVHDSYIAGMKDTNNDAQAIGGWSSLGPTVIVNNFLEASGENILYGGSWPSYYPLANQNKTFISNLIYKPFVWKYGSGAAVPSGACLYDQTGIDSNHQGGEFWLNTMTSQGYVCNAGTWTTTSSIPNHYGVKNIFEFKSGRNFTLTGNVLQGSWTDQQAGPAFTFNQFEGSGPGIADDHIMVVNNLIQNVWGIAAGASTRCSGAAGIGVLPCVNGTPSNHVFKNNLGIAGGLNYCGVPSIPGSCGAGLANAIGGGPFRVVGLISAGTWDHNTFLAPDGITGSPYFPASFSFSVGTVTAPIAGLDRMIIQNSIASYDLNNGVGFAGGAGTYAGLFSNSLWTHNVVSNTAAVTVPLPAYYTNSPGASNTMNNTGVLALNSDIGFVNLGARDYHLATTSPYSAACSSGCAFIATDGTDLGADVDLVNMATSGAAAGTPPWDQQAGLQLTLGSTQIVFRYKAPTSSACTATIYTAPARISANQAAAVSDSSANSVSDGLTRQLYVSGLTASRRYWYKLACGGGVLLVGEAFTRAAGSGTSQFSFDWSSPVPMQYSASRSLSGAVSLPAATRQFIPVAANSVVYVQVGTTGPITILIAP